MPLAALAAGEPASHAAATGLTLLLSHFAVPSPCTLSPARAFVPARFIPASHGHFAVDDSVSARVAAATTRATAALAGARAPAVAAAVLPLHPLRRALASMLLPPASAAARATAPSTALAPRLTPPQPPRPSALLTTMLPLILTVFSLPTVAQVEAALADWAKLAPLKPAKVATAAAAPTASSSAVARTPAPAAAAAKPKPKSQPKPVSEIILSTAIVSPAAATAAWGAFAARTLAVLSERSPVSKRLASAMHTAVGQPRATPAALTPHASPLSRSIAQSQSQSPPHSQVDSLGSVLPLSLSMSLEYRVVARVSFCAFGNGDFHAGVRAHLIDKTGRPLWGNYAALWRRLGAPLCAHCASSDNTNINGSSGSGNSSSNSDALSVVGVASVAGGVSVVEKNKQTGLCVSCDMRSQAWLFCLYVGLPLATSAARARSLAKSANSGAASQTAVAVEEQCAHPCAEGFASAEAEAVASVAAVDATAAAVAPALPMAKWQTLLLPTEGVELFESIDHEQVRYLTTSTKHRLLRKIHVYLHKISRLLTIFFKF